MVSYVPDTGSFWQCRIINKLLIALRIHSDQTSENSTANWVFPRSGFQRESNPRQAFTWVSPPECCYSRWEHRCSSIFENDPECKSRNLSLHTYSIVPLSRSTGLIEWMSDTKTIKNMIWTKWSELAVNADLESISEENGFVKDSKVSANWDKIMIITKDVLWECLRERFPTAEAMFNCRTKFIYSYAAWCIIGYFIGLGDRHLDNIMLHTNTGEVSHVDFDLIFERGKKLKVVERVPFRLTRNVIDVFGVLREKCIFKKVCKVVWKAVKVSKQNVLGFLSSFIHDPIFEDKYLHIKENPEVYLKRIIDKISCFDVLLNNEQTISSFTPIYLPVKTNIV